MNKPTSRVHVVFKTHLDIGFTDLASTVTERYLASFIPAAIETATELERRGGRERLVWTTGTWLIDAYLSRVRGAERERLEKAIEAGYIAWHALPFTTHSELLDAELCDFGLSIAARLDDLFGKRTIAGKLTDVPGHTLALVPLLAKRGIRFLHIGVNGGSCVPELPRVFRWRAPGGEEVLVQYDGGYGDVLTLPFMDDALVVVNSQDNLGPPGCDEVLREFARLAEAFPGAEIVASTLDAFAERLLVHSERFPLVTEEIGDTWIHGAATDPLKIARYRELLRLRSRWTADGSLAAGSEPYDRFSSSLSMIAEHTCGLDFKKFLGDYRNWAPDDFASARSRDLVGEDAVPEEFRFINDYAALEFAQSHPEAAEWERRYSFFESAHAEQRAYLDKAQAALPERLRREAAAALEALTPIMGDPGAGETAEAGSVQRTEAGELVFAGDGSLVSFRDRSGRELVSEDCGLGVYRYECFGPEEYEAWHRDYNRNMDGNAPWALADFGKPGIARVKPRPRHALHAPVLRTLRRIRGSDFDEFTAFLDSGYGTPRGAPRKLALRYRLPHNGSSVEISIDWFEKEATRLPEALWLSFGPALATPSRLRMRKLSMDLSPLDVVRGGNRAYHAVEALGYLAADLSFRLEPLDSPLVSFGERKLLRFDRRFADLSGGLHFNLYNNVWGTNFPLWYGENGRSRFILHFA